MAGAAQPAGAGAQQQAAEIPAYGAQHAAATGEQQPEWVQTPQGWVSTDPAYAGWVYTADGWVQAQQAQQWPAQGQRPQEQPRQSRGWRVIAIAGALVFVLAAAGGFVGIRFLLGGDTIISSPDDTMSLVVPSGWREEAVIGGASFSFGAVNTVQERYLGVVELSKADVVRGATLGDVSQQFQAGIFTTIEGEQILSTSPAGTTIAGLPAVELVFRGDYTEGVLKGNFGWVTTIFDSPDRYVVVTAWTPGDKLDATLPELRKIMSTFKIDTPSV